MYVRIPFYNGIIKDIIIIIFCRIINSNQSHIVKLTPDQVIYLFFSVVLCFQHIKCIPTTHQYLLISDSPAKEEQFRQRKLECGTVWAFHGSPIENWHSIIRRGYLR